MLLVGIGAFLVVQAPPAPHHDHANFLTSFAWSPDDTPPGFGTGVLAYGTLLSFEIALGGFYG